MKPSELQELTLKQIRMALPVKTKGAEYTLADMLVFCNECNKDRFHFVSLVKLISHFYQVSSKQDREAVPAKIKIEGLTMLLENQLVVKSTRHHIRFSNGLKKSLEKQFSNSVVPMKSKISEEPKSMTATTSR